MKYLIFRTDRIGDFLITSPLINAIKKSNTNTEVFVVSSNKNNLFIVNCNFVDKVFLLKNNNLLNKIKLYFELKKYSFDAIIVSDKKNRSILLTLFLKSRQKVFNVSKIFPKRILKLFFNNVYLDNDHQINSPIKTILNDNCNSLNITLKDENFHYLSKNQFLNNYKLSKGLNLDNNEYVIIHCDEKWELENYSKNYKKASSMTDLKVNTKMFVNFLLDFSEQTSKNIILTTGTINTKLIDGIKLLSKKINDNVYEINLKGRKAHLLLNQDFFAISHLISKCALFVSCHGAFTHIASIYKVKILDIIENSKSNHYNRITHHMIKYKSLNRDNFAKLSKTIINNS